MLPQDPKELALDVALGLATGPVGKAGKVAWKGIKPLKEVLASNKISKKMFDWFDKNRTNLVGRKDPKKAITIPTKKLRDPELPWRSGSVQSNIRKRVPGLKETEVRDAQYLENLKKDIRKKGIKDPVTVDIDPKTGEVEIIDGTHRIMLAEEIGIERVPVVLTPNSVGSHLDPAKDAAIKTIQFLLKAGASPLP